jgi:hypothetical protein
MYKRTVRCRYCYKDGHTYATCESLKVHVAANPNSYWAARLSTRKESAKHRKCSYCNEEGHNKKTCSSILSDKVKIAAANINFRKKFYENIIVRDGIVPGALVKMKRASGYVDGVYRYDLKDQIALVVDLKLSEVNALQGKCVTAIVVQYLHITDYSSVNQAKGFPDIPIWYVLGKEVNKTEQDTWMYPDNNMEVVSRGYYDIDNVEEWSRDVKSIENIQASLGDHHSVANALNHYYK